MPKVKTHSAFKEEIQGNCQWKSKNESCMQTSQTGQQDQKGQEGPQDACLRCRFKCSRSKENVAIRIIEEGYACLE